MSNWLENSEIVTGLILQKRLSLNAVRPEIFYGEFRNMIKEMKEGRTEPEYLIQKYGLDLFQGAVEAEKHVNGAGDMADWAKMLEQSATMDQVGIQLEKLSRKFREGEPNWPHVKALLKKSQENINADYTPLSQIESGKVKFIDSGWIPFDEHIGGYPEAGLIVMGGDAGVGKTSTMVKMASSFAKRYKNKVVAVHSIEMVLREIAGRFREVEKLPEDVEDRIYLDDIPVSPEETINRASTIENLGMVIIDFADLMIRGETNESSMAHIYRELMLGAKSLRVPIILLSQLSYKYDGGIPRVHHLRYTSLAKALAWMIIMIYNPNKDYYNEKEIATLPAIEDRSYVIVWKVRGGFRKHINESPGAIQIPFRGDKGWHPKHSKWFSLAKYD
jgi:replicative DNA helicase